MNHLSYHIGHTNFDVFFNKKFAVLPLGGVRVIAGLSENAVVSQKQTKICNKR